MAIAGAGILGMGVVVWLVIHRDGGSEPEAASTPVSPSPVSARDRPFTIQYQSDADGQFEIDSLPPGT